MGHQRNFGIKDITVNPCKNKSFCEPVLEYSVQSHGGPYLVALLLRLKINVRQYIRNLYQVLEYMHSFKEQNYSLCLWCTSSQVQIKCSN